MSDKPDWKDIEEETETVEETVWEKLEAPADYKQAKISYNPNSYAANKRITAEEWNALMMTNIAQGNRQESYLATIINTHLKDHRESINNLMDLKADKTYVDGTFIQKVEKGQIGGVASLDNKGKVPFNQLPDKLLGKTLDDFAINNETGLGTKYYSDGTTANIQFPTGSGGGGIDPSELDGLLYNPNYDNNTHILSFDIMGGGSWEMDLPIEQLIRGLAVDGTDLVLTLESGEEQRVPMSALLVGMASENWVTANFAPRTKNTIKSSKRVISTNNIHHYTYTQETDPGAVNINIEVLGMPQSVALTQILTIVLGGYQGVDFYSLDLFNKLRDNRVLSIDIEGESIFTQNDNILRQINGISYNLSEDKNTLIITGYYQYKTDLYYTTLTLVKDGSIVLSDFDRRKASEGGGGSASKAILFGESKFEDGVAHFSKEDTMQEDDKFVALVEKLGDGSFITLAHEIEKFADGSLSIKASTPFAGRILIGATGGGGGGGSDDSLIKSGSVSFTPPGEDIELTLIYEYTGNDPGLEYVMYDFGEGLPIPIPLPLFLWLFIGMEAGGLEEGNSVDYELISILRNYNILNLRVNGFIPGNIFDLSIDYLAMEEEGEGVLIITAYGREPSGEISGLLYNIALSIYLNDNDETAIVDTVYVMPVGEEGGSGGDSEFITEGWVNVEGLGDILIKNKSKHDHINDLNVFYDGMLSWVPGRLAPLLLALNDVETMYAADVDIFFHNEVKSILANVDNLIYFGCDNITYFYDELDYTSHSMTINNAVVPSDGGQLLMASFKVIFVNNHDGTYSVSTTMSASGESGGQSKDGWNLIDWRTESQYWGLVGSRGQYGRTFHLELNSYHSDAYVKLAISMAPGDEQYWNVRIMEAYNASQLFNNLKLGSLWLEDPQNPTNYTVPGIVLYVSDGSLKNIGIGWKVSNPEELNIINTEQGGFANHLLDIYSIQNT